MDKVYPKKLPQAELDRVAENIADVEKVGFGEVRVLIKNGKIYRILTTVDKIFESNKS